MTIIRCMLGALLVLTAMAGPANANTFWVTTNADAGGGSLRKAITDANNTPTADTIVFALPAAQLTIKPLTSLPFIWQPVTIDGTTQPGSNGQPIVELSGELIGTSTSGLSVYAGGTTIRGLTINRFGYSGITLNDGDNNTVQGCRIGTDPTGTLARPNGVGIRIEWSSTGNLIGGGLPANRNLISGNTWQGLIANFGADGNVIGGNYVGTNAAGTAAIPNGSSGIRILTNDNLIGVGAVGNLVSGNVGDGILVDGGTSGNSVVANLVGVAAGGTTALPNTGGGITFYGDDGAIGGSGAGQGNVASGNVWGGITVHGDRNTVVGNRAGTNALGNAAVGNGYIGIYVTGDDNQIGGTTAGMRNLVSGNGASGIVLDGEGNVCEGNVVGVTLAGTSALPNGGSGFSVHGHGNRIGGTAAGAGNVASGNQYQGIFLSGVENVAEGNRVGTDAAGTLDLGNESIGIWVYEATDAIVGGAAPGAGNLISGNGGTGIEVGNLSTGATILGNTIGLSAAGNATIPNAGGITLWNGGHTVGTPGAGNVIAGSQWSGLMIYGMGGEGASGNVVQANLIGVGPDGTTPRPNAQVGIYVVAAWDNLIGGDGPGEGNVVAHNGMYGIFVDSGAGNTISGNSLFSNGGFGGIDLAPYGIAMNDAGDADLGPNETQNFPIVTDVQAGGSTTTVTGTLDAAPGRTHQVELFASPTCNPAGFGEGRTFLGTTTAITDGSGHAAFAVTLPVAVADPYVTATATTTSGDTSEFSPCALTSGPNPGTLQFSQAQYVGYEFEPDGVVTITVTRSLGVAGTVSVHYATSSVAATPGVDYVETSGTLTFGPGEVVKTFDVPVIFDLDPEGQENIALTLSAPGGGAVLGAQNPSKIALINYGADLPVAYLSDATVVEGDAGGSAMQFTMTVSPHTAPVTVHWQTEGGTASPGVDFTPMNGQTVFQPNDAPKTITVPITGDDDVEDVESMFVRITGVFDGLVADAVGEGRIQDDDGLPPLCVNGTSIAGARVLMKRLGGPVGDESATFSGRMLFAAGQPAGLTPLDAGTHGAQIVIEDLGAPGAPLIDLTHWTAAVPPGPQAAVCTPGKLDGWRANTSGTSFTYQNRSMLLPGAGCTAGSAQGLKKLSLKDKRAGSGRIDAKATFGKASIPAIVGPLKVTVVLGADAASGAAGACGSAVFAAPDCTFNSAGTMFMCQ